MDVTVSFIYSYSNTLIHLLRVHASSRNLADTIFFAFFNGHFILSACYPLANFIISHRQGIIVENQTKYDLEYVTHSYKVGWPVGDVKKGFEDRGDCTFVLPPGSVGTQLWKLHQGGGFFKFMTAGVIATSCTESYFSVRIRYSEHSPISCYVLSSASFCVRSCVNPASWIPQATGMSFRQPLGDNYVLIGLRILLLPFVNFQTSLGLREKTTLSAAAQLLA